MYRSAEGGRVLTERAARIAEGLLFNIEGAIGAAEQAVSTGEMAEDVLTELRSIHTLVRQRALDADPQGRLV